MSGMQPCSALLLSIVAMTATSASAHAQSACTLTGRPNRLPIVVPEVGDAIVVTGHRAEVVLDAAHTHAEARVGSPIAFHGTVDPVMLILHTRPGRSLAGGTLRLYASANVHFLADGSVEALIGPGITAALPFLPCSDLTLTPPAERHVDASRRSRVTHVIDALVVLPLHASADAEEPVATLRTTQPVEVTVASVRGDRALLVTDFGMGRVHGWVAASLLTAIEPHEPVMSLMGDMLGGMCGRSDHPYAYDGPARIRAGATVRGPSGAEWGRVTRTLAAQRIGVRSFDAGQVELLRVEGLESLTCGLDLLFDLAVVSTDEVVSRMR